MNSNDGKEKISEADAIEALISSATAKQKERGYNNNNNNNNNNRGSNRNDYYTNPTNDKRDNYNSKRQKTSSNKGQPADEYYSRPSDRNKSSANTASSSGSKWGKQEEIEKDDNKEQEPKVRANFALSGALSKDAAMNNNTSESIVYNGIKLKFSEPPDAKIPKTSAQWRLYVFKPNKDSKKDAELIEEFPITKQSAYLFGREKAVADILVEHSSLSRQHCVLQCKFCSSIHYLNDSYFTYIQTDQYQRKTQITQANHVLLNLI